jgi:hypothetical protein
VAVPGQRFQRPLSKESPMNATPGKRRSRARRFITRLAVGVLVAVSAVTFAAPPAQAADESIAVNFRWLAARRRTAHPAGSTA